MYDMPVDLAELAPYTESKPAPGPLVAVQAFANTIDVEAGTDALATQEEFGAWLAESGLTVVQLPVDGAELTRAVELRDAIRSLLAANAHGAPDRDAARRLRVVADLTPVPLAVDEDGRLGPDLAPAGSVERFLAAIIGIVFQAQVRKEWERLKLCRNDECLWAFYDESRNRGGTWCEMRVCGNRIKNRHYRTRHHYEPDAGEGAG